MKTFGIKKVERLQKFNFLFRKGTQLTKDDLKIFYQIKGGGVRRFGICPSRKIKGSVKKNRIKRLIREFWRLNKEKLKEGVEIVFAPQSEYLAKLKYWEMEEKITALLKEAKIIDG
jgi:ribonuclease P protein component